MILLIIAFGMEYIHLELFMGSVSNIQERLQIRNEMEEECIRMHPTARGQDRSDLRWLWCVTAWSTAFGDYEPEFESLL